MNEAIARAWAPMFTVDKAGEETDGVLLAPQRRNRVKSSVFAKVL